MENKIEINGKQVVRSSVVMENVDLRDLPDFCDAYASEAEFADGTSLTEAELETLTEKHGNELAHASLF